MDFVFNSDNMPLDNFKKGNETINFHARDFVRTLDTFDEEKLFNGGFRIGSKKGRLIIKLEKDFHEDLSQSFSKQKADHQILNIAYHAVIEYPKKSVMLVSKDVNLRMKAKSLGILAKDYTSDHVKDISTLYTGRRIEEGVDDEVIDQMYQEPFEAPVEEVALKNDFTANEYMILKSGKKSALAKYDSSMKMIKHIH